MLLSVLALLLLALGVSCVDAQEDFGSVHQHLQVAARLPAEPPTVDDAGGFTLADLEAFALQNNPTLAAAVAEVNVARGRHVQAGLYPNPVVGYHGVEMGLRDTAGQQGGIISQRFITAGKLGLDQAIARREIDAAHHRYHAQQYRVLSDVRVRFYQAMVAQRRETLSEELARIGDQLVDATSRLVAGRQGTENDLLQAEISSERSQILLDNARNQHRESWRRLVAVVGLPTMPPAPLTGALETDLPQLDWDGSYQNALHGNPALQAARTRVSRARLVIRRARREPIPNVDVSVSVRHHNVTQDDVANVQLGIPLPLFDKNQGNIRSAQAEWVAACSEVKRLELMLQDRLAVAFRRYVNARQQVVRYRERMVPRAEKSLQLVTEGYEKGQVEYLTLLTAQQTYVQVNLSYLDSLQELHAAASLLEGRLLTDSLAGGR